ncbi:uncharacterized protein patl2 isoform X3 [Mobula birostris]|uniref:uncharacterized protein patl2 isoform X3 n=1 Tax=Mobula birostris TaxID=1983395 RepID=UPI003B289769
MELTESGEVEEFPLPTDEGYLQEVKDDEDIDLYNEETFGIDSESGAELSEDLSLLCEALGASRSKGAEEMPQAEVGLESHPFPEKRVGKSPDQDPKVSEGPSAAQELSDPAVVEAIHGQPSLEPSGSVPPLPFRPLSPMLPGRKLMTMRFGSPSPSAYFSSSPKLLEAFRFPGRVTQLHPQHSRILSQRQQRMRRESTKEPNAGVDAFGKLMTDKEKTWIIKLQMIQLQSENPHLDDYYYQEFFRKLELKLQDEELGKDVKREPQKLVTPYVQKAEMYDSVVHIEGSLGQVAVSTCYSPRRAIDVVHVLTLEEDPPNLGRQRLHLLDNIEKMYQLLLELEEMETHLVSVPEEKRLMYQSLRDRKLEQLYQRLHVGIREENSELFRILRVRKGIKLLSRLLPLLPPTRCTEILFSVAASLHQLGKEGMDEPLPLLFPALTRSVSSLTFSQLISLLREVIWGGGVPHTLQHIFHNTFSLSFLYVLLSHGESLLTLSCLTEPCVEDFQHWTDIIFLVARELSQTPKSSMAEPLQLPSNLLSLFCRYVDKQTAHTLEDKIETDCPMSSMCFSNNSNSTELQRLPPHARTISGLLLLTAVVGLPLNGLALRYVCGARQPSRARARSRSRPRFALYVISLITADFLFLLLQALHTICRLAGISAGGTLLVIRCLMTACNSSSAFLLAWLSAERALALAFPHWWRLGRSRAPALFACFTSLVLGLGIGVLYGLARFHSDGVPQRVAIWLDFILGFCTPMTIFSVASAYVGCRGGVALPREASRLQAAVIIHAAAFLPCWAPYHVFVFTYYQARWAARPLFCYRAYLAAYSSVCLLDVKSCLVPLAYVLPSREVGAGLRRSLASLFDRRFSEDSGLPSPPETPGPALPPDSPFQPAPKLSGTASCW